jgi:hypothetical protein
MGRVGEYVTEDQRRKDEAGRFVLPEDNSRASLDRTTLSTSLRPAKARSFPQKSICQTALVTNEIFFHSAQFSDTLFGQRKSEMFRSRSVVSMFLVPAFLVQVFLLFAGVCSAQSSGSASTESTATCYLDDGRQVYIRYNPVTAKSEKLSNGKPFLPGGTAMTLFTDAPLTFGGSTIPLGAYSVYPIPARDKWSLAINKNVTHGAAYDEKQDVARSTIETDPVPAAADQLEVAFAHVGQKCTLRIYFGKVATFAEFVAK